MKFSFLIPHRHQLLFSGVLTRAELPTEQGTAWLFLNDFWNVTCTEYSFLKDPHEGTYATLVAQAHGNFLKPAFSAPILTSLCSALNVSLGILNYHSISYWIVSLAASQKQNANDTLSKTFMIKTLPSPQEQNMISETKYY